MLDLSKLKSCYVAGTLGQGGAERQLFYAARVLRENGADVRVLSLDTGGFWEERIKQLGVPVTCIGQDRSRLKRVLRIVKHLRREPAHIVQSQHFYTNAYAALAAMLTGCKGIGALRSNGQFDMSQCGRLGGRINLFLPRILAANSRSSLEYARTHGVDRARLHLLPNVVDTEHFKPGDVNAASQSQSGAPLTLLAAGRLTREKRFDRFITTVHKLRQFGLPVRGWIVGSARGSGNLRPELERQAAALGLLPEGLQFLGSIADMVPIYRKSNILVLTSEHEGTPNVLLEAMAAGLPVVATNVGGVPEIVTDRQTGFLVQAEDLEAQVNVIACLLRDPVMREKIALQARAYVEANHSVRRLSACLSNLYEAALPPGQAHISQTKSPPVPRIHFAERIHQPSIKRIV